MRLNTSFALAGSEHMDHISSALFLFIFPIWVQLSVLSATYTYTYINAGTANITMVCKIAPSILPFKINKWHLFKISNHLEPYMCYILYRDKILVVIQYW